MSSNSERLYEIRNQAYPESFIILSWKTPKRVNCRHPYLRNLFPFVKPCDGNLTFCFNFSNNATSFDFQVNLFQNGTVQFIYKSIFTILQHFNHPMKVGLFDAFILTRESQKLPNQLKNYHNIDLYKELKVWQ